MVDGSEILKSIRADMDKYEAQYKEVCETITKTVKEYNDKLLALQEEGTNKVKQLENTREQIRGMYTGLYNQYHQFTGDTAETTEAPVEAPAPEEKKVTEPKKKTKTTKSELSDEDKAKLAQITGATSQNQTAVKDKNGNEIPEYLQDEYKK